MNNSNKNNNNSAPKQPLNENFRGDGAQTPTYKNPSPMPPVKPPKSE